MRRFDYLLDLYIYKLLHLYPGLVFGALKDNFRLLSRLGDRFVNCTQNFGNSLLVLRVFGTLRILLMSGIFRGDCYGVL